MPKISVKAGTTSKLVQVFAQDSSSTTGAGLTGLVFNTANLVAYYYREGAAGAVKIDSGGGTALVTMTLGTWVSCGFVVVDGTHMAGLYQLGLPDAALAAGAKSVVVYLSGATNLAPVVLEIELTGTDNQDATAGGLANLDAAVSSRSTYAGGDTAGTTTLLARVPGTVQPQTGDSFARLGAPAGASIAADLAEIEAETDGIAALAAGVTLAPAGLDGVTVEAGLNARQALSIIAAATGGVLAGAGTASITIAAANNPGTNRITATVDAAGDRTVVTLTPPP